MNIKCSIDDKLEFTRRIIDSCGEKFSITKEKIYQLNTVNYFGESVEQFYTICPNCGYLVYLDKNLLSEEEKEYARDKSRDEELLFLRNNILSELMNTEYRIKVRKKTL